MSRFVARLLLVALPAIAAACDKVPLLAPTESTIIISSNSTTLPINGTAEILATVTEQAGTPVHNGTTVTFTASVGTIEPREARTENGIARATFRAGSTSGTARVGAFSGSARADEVEILVGGAAASTVIVRAEPATVPQTGGTVSVIATVSDASGNRLPGAPVVFSADNGTLGSNSGVTDQNGELRTTLTTSRQTVVRASVAGKEGQATISVVNVPTVTITVAPTQPLVDTTTTFTVTPGSTTNGNPIQNVLFDFGDGSPPISLGAISGATPVSHTYRRADTYTVTATITDTAGQSTPSRIVISVLRPSVVVSVVPSTTLTTVGTSVSFSVSISNPNNVNIQSVVIRFGDGKSATLTPTGGSASNIYSAPGLYTVRAIATDVSGTTYEGTTQVQITEAAAFNVTLDAAQGDPAIPISCNPTGATYPKTCTATLIGAGVRVIFTAGCNTGFGAGGACANAIRYQWSFGDGGSDTTTSNSTDHVFRTRGEFLVTVTVVNNNGTTSTQRLTMIIQ